MDPMAVETITIAGRFRGPPASGNGGYVCGVIAGLFDSADPRAAPEVTLRSPVPLDTPLEVRRNNKLATIHHGDKLIAEARMAALELAVPPAPSFARAWEHRARSPALIKNISRRFPDRIGVHPVCFCCGAENRDGLQVFAAAIDAEDGVAAAWPTELSWADDGGELPAPFIWTALDCPGQFAYYAAGIRTGMLGRLSARIDRSIRAGERCVVTGWRIGVEGRKHYAGTAVFDERGNLCACAKAIWVGLRE